MMSWLAITVPLVLWLLRAIIKRRQDKLPSWKEIDPSSLKVGGTQKRLTEAADIDVIVIGSGLGGLTSAVLLSKVGYKVIVLEQASYYPVASSYRS